MYVTSFNLVKNFPEGLKNHRKKKKKHTQLRTYRTSQSNPNPKKNRNTRQPHPAAEVGVFGGTWGDGANWGTEQPMFDQVETLWEIVYNPNKITSFYSSQKKMFACHCHKILYNMESDQFSEMYYTFRIGIGCNFSLQKRFISCALKLTITKPPTPFTNFYGNRFGELVLTQTT